MSNFSNIESKPVTRPDIPARFNELNALDKHWARYAAVLKGINVPPYEVLIHSSSSCNLRCSWCIGEHVPYENDIGDSDENIIARDSAAVRSGMFLSNKLSDVDAMLRLLKGIVEYKKTVEFALGDDVVNKDFKVETVSFSGLIGEPLSSKKSMIAAINYLADNDVSVGLFTNATLFDEAVISTLLRAEYVLVSLDASTASTYSMLKYGGGQHGEKLFHRAIQNLRDLVVRRNNTNSRLKVNASFILYPQNYTELLDAARLAKSCGVDYFRFKQDNSGSRRLSAQEAAHAKELIRQAIEELQDDDFIIVSIHKDLTIEETTRSFSSCQITDLMAAVGSDGCLYPCNYHPRPGGLSYGDATSLSFAEVWEGEARAEMKKLLPSSCPPTCDPFKNRANALMQPLHQHYVRHGIDAARALLDSL